MALFVAVKDEMKETEMRHKTRIIHKEFIAKGQENGCLSHYCKPKKHFCYKCLTN